MLLFYFSVHYFFVGNIYGCRATEYGFNDEGVVFLWHLIVSHEFTSILI